MGRVDDKVAIVTGGGAGIGRASAYLMAAEGAKVVVADIDGQRAASVVKEISAAGGIAIAYRLDVGQPAEIEALMQQAVDQWGRLDILHNNAALTAGWQHAGDLSVLEVDEGTWGRSIAINLESVLYACKYAVPHMIETGGGSIVNTSTNQAFAGDMTQTAYASAKAAVISLSRSVATQFGKKNIRCNVVSPGCILTDNTLDVCPAEVLDIVLEHNLLPRHGYAEDLAKAVLFLASDDASFITGEVIKVDGGQLAHLPQYADLARMGARTTK